MGVDRALPKNIFGLAIFRVDQRLCLCIAVHGDIPPADGNCGAGALSFAESSRESPNSGYAGNMRALCGSSEHAARQHICYEEEENE